MFIDSDSEDWPALAIPRAQEVVWPQEAPISCHVLLLQPASGPLSLPEAVRVGEARVVSANKHDAEELLDQRSRRIRVTAAADVVSLACDDVTWGHADALMAGRLLARFSPKCVIMADFTQAEGVAYMHTSASTEVPACHANRVARGLPAAVASMCEIQSIPAYYLTDTEQAQGGASELLKQLAVATGCDVVGKLLVRLQAHSSAGESLYI
ncbi:hypothetical protein THASP1DRAFT_30500 [Thamnocephalis sphaerospora]|uniref:Uncharacterized protein n=1 Tax=Thamnocephalis sphaerospora TaxID=78915 RepID=A0A4P9XNW5_9FUNG|nr:hypothetical protein THASP1DRAFT_30500 [Thamnocephalis sphaerospora]|eukprot:RKP07683.1 hypothetical protein THASP1DRAFT_30500 [Thamnocephalis sphaerospora]